MRVYRYAALVMPLNVAPALVCLAMVWHAPSDTTVLRGAWAALCSIMGMRAVTSYLPYAFRKLHFARLP